MPSLTAVEFCRGPSAPVSISIQYISYSMISYRSGGPVLLLCSHVMLHHVQPKRFQGHAMRPTPFFRVVLEVLVHFLHLTASAQKGVAESSAASDCSESQRSRVVSRRRIAMQMPSGRWKSRRSCGASPLPSAAARSAFDISKPA